MYIHTMEGLFNKNMLTKKIPNIVRPCNPVNHIYISERDLGCFNKVATH